MERAGGALSPSTFLKTAVELLSGLCELHEAGIVHCGVKPENAVLDESGCVILSGFGVDRLITQSMGSRVSDRTVTESMGTPQCQTGVSSGVQVPYPNQKAVFSPLSSTYGREPSPMLQYTSTPPHSAPQLMTPANTALTLSDGGRYLAPEQWDQDDLEPTPATDAWGAAATLCHLASGTPPFLGLDPWEICRCVCELERPPPVPDEIPEPLLSVVRRAFAIDPTHRATVAELLSAAQSARAAANAGLMERCSAHGGDVPVLSVVPCGDPVPPLARHHVCAKCLGDMVGRARDKLSKMMLSRGGLLACPGGAGTCPGGIHPRRAVQCLVGSGRHEAGDVVCMASRQARLAAEDPEEVRAEELRSQLQGLVGAGREWFDSQVAKHKAAAIALVSDSCSRCQKPMVLPGEGDPMLLRCGSPRCTDGRHSLACGWCLRDCRDDVARALVHVRDCQRNPRKGVPAAPSVREVKQASHSRARARLARYLATNVPDVLVEEVVEALEGTLKALHISGADMLMRVYGQVASKTDAPGWGDVEAVKGMLTTMDGAVDVEDLEGAVHMLGAAHRARGNELGRDDLSCR